MNLREVLLTMNQDEFNLFQHYRQVYPANRLHELAIVTRAASSLESSCGDFMFHWCSRASLQEGGFDSTTRGMRSAVRGLLKNEYTMFQFVDEMVGIMQRRFTQAWLEGAAECNIAADELTDKEKAELKIFINGQIQHLPGFASDIVTASEGEGKFSNTQLYSRAELWARQYLTAFNKGMAMACADQKAEWMLGLTEKHCNTCKRLHGKVKRMSYWEKHVMPQSFPNPYLDCKGAFCDCRLVPTTKPLSKGRLPA